MKRLNAGGNKKKINYQRRKAIKNKKQKQNIHTLRDRNRENL